MPIDNEIKNVILQKSAKLLKQQIKWRRHLHQFPELSNDEFQTTIFLKEQLQKAQIKLRPLKMPTGLIAEIIGDKAGPVVAVRTDIDALPIVEQTGLSYKSKNKGCMHACGHDVHMATVLGTAYLLQEMQNELSGTVRFLFQPAEEMPPGGARPMIEQGALENVDMIFGLHTDPHLQVGRIGLRDGVAMASVTDFDLTIYGVGGHAARPHQAVDAIVTAAELIESIQKIVSREIDPIQPVVITFGKISGGVARNVICDEVKLVGTVRTLSKNASIKVPKRIKEIAQSICKARGAKVKMEVMATYPVLSNHPETNELFRQNFNKLFNKNRIETTDQVLGGEDFACYLEKVKGAMFRLGVMNKKIKADKPWHSPLFIVDEDAIQIGTATLAASVIDFLRTYAK